jgi:dihydrolipoamide dehydrogenase
VLWVLAQASERYDLVVVGGGPGGYPAAIRAADMGLRVLVVEARGLGGECTLYGCVPTKAVLHHAYAGLASSRLGGSGPEPGRVFEEARRVASALSEGIGELLGARGVRVVRGSGRLLGPGVVEVVEPGGGRRRVEAGAVLLAVGTEPASLPGVVVDGRRVLDNRSWLTLPPGRGERLLVVGGGPVGVEAAAAAAMLGSRVVLIEALPRVLPGAPRGLSLYAQRYLRRLGVEVRHGCPLEGLEAGGDGVYAVACGERMVFDRVLVAVGRRPLAREAGAADAGVKLDPKGYIVVDEYMRTSVAGVYAAGDVAGPPLLAHKAMHQSLAAASAIAADLRGIGEPEPYRASAVPTVVHLGGVELAWAGVTVDEARRRPGLEVARVRIGWSMYAHLAGVLDGYAAIVYRSSDGRVVGYEAAAPGAGDAVAEAAVAIERGLTLEELAAVVHPHPERVEQLYEAALAGLGRPLHFLLRRRR